MLQSRLHIPMHSNDSEARGYPVSQSDRHLVQERLNRYYLDVLAAPERLVTLQHLSARGAIQPMERGWLDHELQRIASHDLPANSNDFRDWYFEWARRQDTGTEAFVQFIAEEATQEQIALFFLCEEQVDSKFNDLIAISQIGTSGSVKMAIARNYWDEMGNGRLHLVHTTMFEHSASYMRDLLATTGLDARFLLGPATYANANQLMMYGIYRRFHPRLLGALGILEQCAPRRFAAMFRGCRRVGIPDAVVKYQRVHIEIDRKHGSEWFEQVLQPLAAKSEALMRELCVGVLTRFNVADDYYNHVLAGLGKLGSPAPPRMLRSE